MIKTSNMEEVERLQSEGMKVVEISGGSPQIFTIDDGKKEEPKVEPKAPETKKEDKRGKK